jgi:D-glycero-alpha-D-manno-heptose-7-phosphate kinase
MKIAKARSPLRLGLAGGGTDVSPYCDVFGGNVVNATIDRYSYAATSIASTTNSRLTSFDQNRSLQLRFGKDAIEGIGDDNSLRLHFEAARFFQEKYLNSNYIPLNVETWSEAPRGSGLGGSSSIVVAILSSLAALFEVSLTAAEIAADAVIIERVICRFDGGKQDHYASSYGGLNFMTFEKNTTNVVPISISGSFLLELESRILLFDTGISRLSSDIISNQSQGVQKEDVSVINAMHGMKQEAINMRDAIQAESFELLNTALKNGREFKRASSNKVETERLHEILEASILAGASTGKVSGAGGGGFMMLLVELEKRAKVIEALTPYSGTISNCHFTFKGVETW